MSTRSFTILQRAFRPGNVAELYRHCDGYPAEAGASLVEALTDAPDVETAASRLLALRYDATTFRPSQPIYELSTPGSATAQGDLEHVYLVTPMQTGEGMEWAVTHYARDAYPGDRSGDKAADYTAWPVRRVLSLAELVVAVNEDRRAINARLVELRAEHPGYAADDYPMLPDPTDRSACVSA